MRLGDLDRGHRFRTVTYDSGGTSITGTLEFYQPLEHDGVRGIALTIGGWVSRPLDPDDQLEFNA